MKAAEEEVIVRKRSGKSKVLVSSSSEDSDTGSSSERRLRAALIASKTDKAGVKKSSVSASATLASVATDMSGGESAAGSVATSSDVIQILTPSLLMLPELSLNDADFALEENDNSVIRRRRVASPGKRSVTRAAQTDVEDVKVMSPQRKSTLDDSVTRERLANEVIKLFCVYPEPAAIVPTLAQLFGVDVSRLMFPETAAAPVQEAQVTDQDDWSDQFLLQLDELQKQQEGEELARQLNLPVTSAAALQLEDSVQDLCLVNASEVQPPPRMHYSPISSVDTDSATETEDQYVDSRGEVE